VNAVFCISVSKYVGQHASSASTSVSFWLSYGETKRPDLTGRNHLPFLFCL